MLCTVLNILIQYPFGVLCRLLRGPCTYVPPVQVHVVRAVVTYPLDENEGVYVRDTTTGK